jgi:hypothetical protein
LILGQILRQEKSPFSFENYVDLTVASFLFVQQKRFFQKLFNDTIHELQRLIHAFQKLDKHPLNNQENAQTQSAQFLFRVSLENWSPETHISHFNFEIIPNYLVAFLDNIKNLCLNLLDHHPFKAYRICLDPKRLPLQWFQNFYDDYLLTQAIQNQEETLIQSLWQRQKTKERAKDFLYVFQTSYNELKHEMNHYNKRKKKEKADKFIKRGFYVQKKFNATQKLLNAIKKLGKQDPPHQPIVMRPFYQNERNTIEDYFALFNPLIEDSYKKNASFNLLSTFLKTEPSSFKALTLQNTFALQSEKQQSKFDYNIQTYNHSVQLFNQTITHYFPQKTFQKQIDDTSLLFNKYLSTLDTIIEKADPFDLQEIQPEFCQKLTWLLQNFEWRSRLQQSAPLFTDQKIFKRNLKNHIQTTFFSTFNNKNLHFQNPLQHPQSKYLFIESMLCQNTGIEKRDKLFRHSKEIASYFENSLAKLRHKLSSLHKSFYETIEEKSDHSFLFLKKHKNLELFCEKEIEAVKKQQPNQFLFLSSESSNF